MGSTIIRYSIEVPKAAKIYTDANRAHSAGMSTCILLCCITCTCTYAINVHVLNCSYNSTCTCTCTELYVHVLMQCELYVHLHIHVLSTTYMYTM